MFFLALGEPWVSAALRLRVEEGGVTHSQLRDQMGSEKATEGFQWLCLGAREGVCLRAWLVCVLLHQWGRFAPWLLGCRWAPVYKSVCECVYTCISEYCACVCVCVMCVCVRVCACAHFLLHHSSASRQSWQLHFAPRARPSPTPDSSTLEQSPPASPPFLWLQGPHWAMGAHPNSTTPRVTQESPGERPRVAAGPL